MTNFKIGQEVEFDVDGRGKMLQGTVLDQSDRKVRVAPFDGGEPVSIYKKYVTAISKTNARKAAAKATEKASRAKSPATTGPQPSKIDVMPLLRKDGEPSKSITAGAGVAHYIRGAGKTASGRPTFDINDQVASMLRGLDLDAQYKVVAHKLSELTEEHITIKSLQEKYGHLNPGQQRMNLGNRLRAAFRNAAAE